MAAGATALRCRTDAAISGVGLVPVYQPVVDLVSGETVGFEALARWPDSPDLTPTDVFAAAARTGRLAELDWHCRKAALSEWLAAGLPPAVSLFLNAEPAVLTRSAPAGARSILRRASREIQVVLELTERSLLDRPADVLAQVAEARGMGWLIALDDVGAHPDSVALLDLVAPDVIKLDMSLIQRLPTQHQARTLAAVMAHAERFRSAVVAEGIETGAHQEQAVALGARLGQGWKLGRPDALPVRAAAPLAPVSSATAHCAPTRTPFDLVANSSRIRVARKEFLIAFSRHIEAQAINDADPPVVLAALQSGTHLTRTTYRRYERFAGCSSLVALFGTDLPDHLGTNLRGVALDHDDPLVKEWTVVALGAQTAAALIGRDRGDAGPDLDRRFEFVITYDRDLVTQAARSMLARLFT